MFETYKNLCCRAFLTLRRNADLIINLFSLVSGSLLTSPHTHSLALSLTLSHSIQLNSLMHSLTFTHTHTHTHTHIAHPLTHTDEINRDTRTDVCGGHRLHQECSGTGQNRTRGGAAVPQGHKEMSRPQMDCTDDVEDSPAAKERHTLTLSPSLHHNSPFA